MFQILINKISETQVKLPNITSVNIGHFIKEDKITHPLA